MNHKHSFLISEKEEKSDLKDKLKKMETELGEIIPNNIRELIKKQIEDWEKKDKMFKSQDDQKGNIDFIIEIGDDYLESYLERFIQDWSSGNVTVVFKNNNIKVSSFERHLLQYLLRLDKSEQVTLASTKDTVIPKEEYGSGNTPLIRASYGGYTNIVQWMLHNDADVDQCRDDGVTGLFMASQNGHTDIIHLNNHPKDTMGTLDEIKQVLFNDFVKNKSSHVADYINKKSVDYAFDVVAGSSPLHIACFMGRTDVVRCLLTTMLTSTLQKKMEQHHYFMQ
ncbi:unnamed protein product [Mytilus edulis]|uniref:Ankyrin repeat protein n=1 Tax=Mytilus edulis TaxID=6550 RepID=A0A8S3SX72_MYTED|nr:unnamed protein product [Mytilus edulis]